MGVKAIDLRDADPERTEEHAGVETEEPVGDATRAGRRGR